MATFIDALSPQSSASWKIPQATIDLDSCRSRGSKNHSNGKCNACAFVFTDAGCPAGSLCNFCHHPDHHGAKLCPAKKHVKPISRTKTGPTRKQSSSDESLESNRFPLMLDLLLNFDHVKSEEMHRQISAVLNSDGSTREPSDEGSDEEMKPRTIPGASQDSQKQSFKGIKRVTFAPQDHVPDVSVEDGREGALPFSDPKIPLSHDGVNRNDATLPESSGMRSVPIHPHLSFAASIFRPPPGLPLPSR